MSDVPTCLVIETPFSSPEAMHHLRQEILNQFEAAQLPAPAVVVLPAGCRLAAVSGGGVETETETETEGAE